MLQRIIIIFFTISSSLCASQSLDSLYIELEKNMDQSIHYDKIKEDRIALLEESLNNKLSNIERFNIRQNLIEEYQYYDLNKAFDNIEKNISLSKKISDINLTNISLLKFSQLLISSGRYKESIDILNEIKHSDINRSTEKLYYTNYTDGYSRLTYNTVANESKKQYKLLYNTYKDTLIEFLDRNSEEYLRIQEKSYRDNANINEALIINDIRLKKAKKNSREYSIITFERSILRKDDISEKINMYNKKKNLILSAISDIKLSIKDNASITDLARVLYQENEIEKAHKYINYAFNNVQFYNSLHRKSIMTNTLPLITKAYETRSNEQTSRLKKLLTISIILGVLVFITLILIFSQIKRISSTSKKLKEVNTDLNKLNIKLSKSDKLKQHYLGTFLNLYSEYINQLDMFRKIVRKFIRTNKYNALLEFTKSKQIKDDELNIFYTNFDEAFLNIFPTFIEKINTLLKEEKRMIINEQNKMNTEIRIFALIKLGITSSSQISKILRYSVNTIYNYRANLKNNAIDRNNFEENVKKIE